MHFVRHAIGVLLAVFIMHSCPIIFGQEKSAQQFRIHLEQPAYTGMPLWIHADLPELLTVRYPYSDVLSDIGPNRLEVKRNGQSLTPRPHKGPASGMGIIGGSIAPPTSPQNRLPLHARYELDKPGNYAVRWTELRYATENGEPVEKIVAESDWLTFEVQQSTAERRESWLQKELANNPTDTGLLVGDHLPNLLAAASDALVLRVFLDQLYSPSEMANSIALNSVQFFPDEQMASEAITVMQSRGPAQAMAYLFSWHPQLFERFQKEIVRISVANLQSENQQNVAGSLKTLMFVVPRQHSKWPMDSALLKLADDRVLAAAPKIIARGNESSGQILAEYLGLIKKERSRELLWQIVEQRTGVQREQATIALAWIGDERDLAKLSALLVAPGDADSYGRDRASLPYHLVLAWNERAIPYLENALTKSPYPFVRTQCAEQLAMQGRKSAFEFFLDAVENHRFYKDEMLGFLRGQFASEFRPDADEVTVVAFLKSRISQR